MHVLRFDKDCIQVSADDQTWTKDDFKSLRKDFDIIFDGGIVAFWIERRKNTSPLIHIMIEDDGLLSWDSDHDRCFDAGWLDNWKEIIEKTQTHILSHPRKYNVKKSHIK